MHVLELWKEHMEKPSSSRKQKKWMKVEGRFESVTYRDFPAGRH